MGVHSNPIAENSTEQTIPEQKFRGVSSGYLSDRRPGQLVEVSIVRNERFRLPTDALTPIIMIGAGTGVAPFRGFLQELNQSVSAGSTGQQQREAMLFFGCRNENDYLYRSE